MKNLEQLLSKCDDVIIKVRNESRVLISKDEMREFVTKVHGVQFKSKAQTYKLTKLSYIGSVNASAKIMKGLKKDYYTYIVYLQSYKTLFGNTCANGKHCADACLMTSGRVKMDVKELRILRARYFRTILFYVNRELFNRTLFAEIESNANRYKNFMVRLNGTSDLSPKLFKVDGVTVLDRFPNVSFYDYTKIPNRSNLLENHSNYHLTFSFDGYNMDVCEQMMSKGINVSIVIDGEMPEEYNGVKVFSMDDTDLRPLDELKGKFGYLKLKQTLNKEYDSAFVIKPDLI